MSGTVGKIMGPLMTAGGLIAAPFTGGATLPIAFGGFQQMFQPGGVLGQNPVPAPQPTGTGSAATSSFGPPPGTDVATPAGAGLNLQQFMGPPAAGGAGGSVGSPDLINSAIAAALGGQGGSPFAMYGG